jgi:hypothetical protein
MDEKEKKEALFGHWGINFKQKLGYSILQKLGEFA